MQRPKQSRRQTRIPPGSGAQPRRQPPALRPTTPNRKPLREMTLQERAGWYASQAAELEEFCSFAQHYIKRRERRGRQTETDERYQRFFDQTVELIQGLEELRQETQDHQAAVQRQDNEEE